MTPLPAAVAAATNAPPTRHVVVVENSAHMKDRREPTADLLSRMLLDGFRGRMRIGEVVELWTLEEEVITLQVISSDYVIVSRYQPLQFIEKLVRESSCPVILLA